MEYLLPFIVVLYAILSIVGNLKKTRKKAQTEKRQSHVQRKARPPRSETLDTDGPPNESEVERQIRLFREQKQRAQQSSAPSVSTRPYAESAARQSDKRKKTASYSTQARSTPPALPPTTASTPSQSNGTMTSNIAFAEDVTRTTAQAIPSVSPTATTPLITAADVTEMLHDRQSVARIFVLNEVFRRPW